MTPALLPAALLAAQTGPASSAARIPVPAPPAAAATPAPPTDWPPISLFTQDDYPARAFRGGEEGRVRYRLEIGTDGRVRSCSITGSSGSEALDSGTCRIVTRRARFAPARDSAGHAVPDARDGEVTWRLGPDSGEIAWRVGPEED